MNDSQRQSFEEYVSQFIANQSEDLDEKLTKKLNEYVKRELCKLISFLKLGRKYNDKKADLIKKLYNYFISLNQIENPL